jgi:hypothetical protein
MFINSDAGTGLLLASVIFILEGVRRSVAFFMSDDWDRRPQWQREADELARWIPRGKI